MTPMRKTVLPAAVLGAGLLLTAACLTPVAELYCVRNADCASPATCDAGQCFWPDGGLAPGADAGHDAGPGGGTADAGSCEAHTCSGCCRGTICLPGDTPAACGLQGQACFACPGGLCQGGECLGGGGDAGTAGGGVAIGGSCTFSSDCATDAYCVPPEDFQGSTGFPGGACVQLCSGARPCPAGSQCVAAGLSTTVCMATCPAPGGQSTCRTGYRCQAGTGSTGWCRPACTNGGLAACTAPSSCEAATGLCR